MVIQAVDSTARSIEAYVAKCIIYTSCRSMDFTVMAKVAVSLSRNSVALSFIAVSQECGLVISD